MLSLKYPTVGAGELKYGLASELLLVLSVVF